MARLLIGLVLVLAGVGGYAGLFWVAFGPIPQSLAAIGLVIIGGILLATGLSRKCPINAVIGVNTNRSTPTERRESTEDIR
jgi:carbon starvation protein CstA